MSGQDLESIRFWQGQRLFQVAPAYEGDGYVGLCDGRIVAKAPDRASVARALIMGARWHSTFTSRAFVPNN